MFDVLTGQATQVAQHDAPIKVVRWVDMPGAGILATGSWDKTIKVSACNHLLFCGQFTSDAFFTVLGPSCTCTGSVSDSSRAMLCIGRTVSSDGSWNSRAPHSDFQFNKSDNAVQGELSMSWQIDKINIDLNSRL